MDLVTALFSFADDVCDAAEDAFAFLGAAFVAIENVGTERELKSAGSWFVCCIPSVSEVCFWKDRGERNIPSTLDATLSAPSSSFTLTSRVLVTLLSLFLSRLFPSGANLSVVPDLAPGRGLLVPLASSSISILPAFLFRFAFLPLELLCERDICNDSSEASRNPARILMLSSRLISSDLPSMMWLTSSLILTFSRYKDSRRSSRVMSVSSPASVLVEKSDSVSNWWFLFSSDHVWYL